MIASAKARVTSGLVAVSSVAAMVAARGAGEPLVEVQADALVAAAGEQRRRRAPAAAAPSSSVAGSHSES